MAGRESCPTRIGVAGLGPLAHFLDRVIAALKIPAPDTPELVHRIQIMERRIILPVKAAGVAMLLYSFYFTPWIGQVSSALDVEVEATQYFLGVYIGVNVVVDAFLLGMRRLHETLVQWIVFV